MLLSQDSHPQTQTTSGFMYLMEDSRSTLLLTTRRQFTLVTRIVFLCGRSNGDEHELGFVDFAFLE